MQHQQRLAQVAQALFELLRCDVVQEFLADAEGAARERDLDLALLLNVGDMLLEQTGDVPRIGRRRNRRDRARFRHLRRGGQHRRAAEAVADQDRGRLIHLAQVIRGRDQIGDVGGKRRVGELALARAEPGEIETQHRDAARRQCLRDALCRQIVLAAGEAVREQRERDRLTRGLVEQRGKLFAARIGKVEAFGRHRVLPIACPAPPLRPARAAPVRRISPAPAAADGPSNIAGSPRRSHWNNRRSRCADPPAAR